MAADGNTAGGNRLRNGVMIGVLVKEIRRGERDACSRSVRRFVYAIFRMQRQSQRGPIKVGYSDGFVDSACMHDGILVVTHHTFTLAT